MLIALTHRVSPRLEAGEITFIDRQTIDLEQANQQHNAYCQLLEQCGVTVRRLEANVDSPDACFIEDTAIVVDEIAVLTRMGAVSRQHEPKAIAPYLSQYRTVISVEPPATLEGGDVLQIGRRLYVGLSGRTNQQGCEALSQILSSYDYEVIPVETQGCLHLKTACTAIDDETLLLNPQWIDPDIFSGCRVVTVAEAEPWAANTIRVREKLVMQAGFPQTLERVSKYHNSIQLADISEFRKVEAGLSCLSLLFNH